MAPMPQCPMMTLSIMTTTAPPLGVYYAALLDYLLWNDESSLLHAYDLGRSGLSSGCGLLQMLHVHEKALGMILNSATLDDATRTRMEASTKFLTEALSAYGMASEGYRRLLKTR
jgi:phosphoserine phosphatase RsbU-like protein